MNRSKVPAAVGLLAAGALAGGVLGTTLSANAADSASTTSPSSGDTATETPPADAFGSEPVRGDESSVSSSLAATLTEKAEAETDGTVYRVETDSGDAAYEAHVKKSDGSLVTVKFDEDGNVTDVEDGMGK